MHRGFSVSWMQRTLSNLKNFPASEHQIRACSPDPFLDAVYWFDCRRAGKTDCARPLSWWHLGDYAAGDCRRGDRGVSGQGGGLTWIRPKSWVYNIDAGSDSAACVLLSDAPASLRFELQHFLTICGLRFFAALPAFRLGAIGRACRSPDGRSDSSILSQRTANGRLHFSFLRIRAAYSSRNSGTTGRLPQRLMNNSETRLRET